jgi:5-methylcytosine-specific restriction endonuclease McrA
VKHCFEKAEWQRRNRAKAKSEGRCPTCCRSTENAGRCDACKAQVRAHYVRNRERKIAYWCKRQKTLPRELLNKYARASYRHNPERFAAAGALRRACENGSIGTLSAHEWRLIVDKQHGRCAMCGKKTVLHRDHVVPLSRGGAHYAFNIQGLCKSCNSKKKNKVWPGLQHTLFDRV